MKGDEAMTILSIRPLDVLIFRGNRLFGGGVHGVGQMPPWPSVVTGAVVSRVFADRGIIARVTHKPSEILTIIEQELGADFTLTFLGILKNGKAWFPVPSDLGVFEGKNNGRKVAPVRAKRLPEGVSCSMDLPWACLMENPVREKPAAQMWLSAEALREHFSGKIPDCGGLLTSSSFWANDPRLGIALDGAARTVVEGAIYTTDALALCEGVELCAGFRGRNLPTEGLIRLGGDGRGSILSKVSSEMERQVADLGKPERGWKAFRMVLATPGLFPDGSLPPVVDETRHLHLDGLEAELVAASVPPPAVVSGWDLAQHAPKPAHRVVPAGSCYWFRVKKGDTRTLENLWRDGLWNYVDPRSRLAARRHEGWNRVWFGVWDY